MFKKIGQWVSGKANRENREKVDLYEQQNVLEAISITRDAVIEERLHSPVTSRQEFSDARDLFRHFKTLEPTDRAHAFAVALSVFAKSLHDMRDNSKEGHALRAQRNETVPGIELNSLREKALNHTREVCCSKTDNSASINPSMTQYAGDIIDKISEMASEIDDPNDLPNLVTRIFATFANYYWAASGGPH